MLGVWDGGGVVCAAPAAGDGGGAAVWPLLKIEIIRRHDDSSATANHAFFEFIKPHLFSSRFRCLERLYGEMGQGRNPVDNLSCGC